MTLERWVYGASRIAKEKRRNLSIGFGKDQGNMVSALSSIVIISDVSTASRANADGARCSGEVLASASCGAPEKI